MQFVICRNTWNQGINLKIFQVSILEKLPKAKIITALPIFWMMTYTTDSTIQQRNTRIVMDRFFKSQVSDLEVWPWVNGLNASWTWTRLFLIFYQNCDFWWFLKVECAEKSSIMERKANIQLVFNPFLAFDFWSQKTRLESLTNTYKYKNRNNCVV